MKYEFSIDVCNNKLKIIMLDGFITCSSPNDLHKHIYSELHLIVKGEVAYLIGDERYTLQKGDALLIESNVQHKCENNNSDFCYIAFMIYCDTPLKHKKFHIDLDILQNILKEVENYYISGDATKLKAYLMLICTELFEEKKSPFCPLSDRKAIITEFFTSNYSRDTNIGELADELKLSEKQVSRLVKYYTGNDFKTELVKTRISAAKVLIAEGSLSLTQIAEKVGYNSYSGFWKAYNKYKNVK